MHPRDESDPTDEPPPPLWPKASGRPPGERPAGSSPDGHVGGDRSSDRPEHDDAEAVDSRGGSDTNGSGAGAARRDSDDTRNRSGRGAAGFFRELPILILVAFLLAFLLRTFVLQVFFIPSSSMEPTLQVDDRMVVEKITFRFREPRPGDVVVFEGDNGPVNASASGGDRLLRGVGQFLGVIPASARDFVKRVIAVGGDELRIEEGQVFVNDRPLDEPYVIYGDEDDFGPVTVPDGHLFFLGDNRPNSSDSRRSLGFVERDAVVGRAVVVIWPLEHWDSLTGVEHDSGPSAHPARAAPAVSLPR